jgi:dynein heavy chain
MSTNKALLKKLEDTLLRELSNATGNILDNQELISTLESAKEKAVDISTKLAAAKTTARDIEEARVRYTPVATRGAVLFFAMSGLSAVNNMYEYSLAAFLKVFKQVCSLAGKVSASGGLQARMRCEARLRMQHHRHDCLVVFCLCSHWPAASGQSTWRAASPPSPAP